MGRTKSPMSTDLNAEVPLSDDLNISLNTMAQHRVEIMQQFGDGLPYERDRIVHEARFYMAQSAEAMLEAGKRLIILKENEPHGDFINIVESELSMSKRTAQVMMQASIKYLSPQLESKAQDSRTAIADTASTANAVTSARSFLTSSSGSGG